MPSAAVDVLWPPARTVTPGRPAPFQVARPLMDRAFTETYGLETKDVFGNEDLAISSYRKAVSELIPELTRIVKPGGVYLGVAPDQNFTLITALAPSIAFIVDIRHQNAVLRCVSAALVVLASSGRPSDGLY